MNSHDQILENKPVISSYLLKRHKTSHKWLEQWVVLRSCQLSYYKDCSEKKPKKVFNRDDLLSFSEIPDKKHHFAIYSSSRAIHLRTDDKYIYDQWIMALIKFFCDKGVQEDNQEKANTEVYQRPSVSKMLKEETTSLEPTQMDPEFIDNRRSIQSLSVITMTDKQYIIEQGNLSKLNKRYQRWKDFYVILTNKAIHLYRSNKSFAQPYQKISNKDIIDVIELDSVSKTRVWCILIITPLERIKLSAANETEVMKWLSALKTISLIYKF